MSGTTHRGDSAPRLGDTIRRPWPGGSIQAMRLLGAALVAIGTLAAQSSIADEYRDRRAAMVEAVARMAREAAPVSGVETIDARVMEALAKVPRHEFVPEALRRHAYLNRPLPIGEDQTISQPYIVALMTDLLDVEPGQKVFEVGTGSGYQAAVLAALGVEVYSIEIVPVLARRAAATLARLGVERVHVRSGDGYAGWPEAAPFDAIIVTAGASHVPAPLLAQLRTGAKMVIPVGPLARQELLVIEKRDDGSVTRRRVLPVRFVPLTGGH